MIHTVVATIWSKLKTEQLLTFREGNETMELAPLVDIAISAGIVFVTVWFFFVQSPFLFNRLGRQKFVPIMMQITQLYFKFIMALNVASFVVSLYYTKTVVMTSVLALAATCLNYLVIVPKALQKGRQSMRERVGTDNTSDIKDFVVEGGSKTETKTMHQMVVVFVLVMVGAHVVHMLSQ